MGNVCYTCMYSAERRYCGKGMSMGIDSCSGYSPSSMLAYSIQPGCPFPVSKYERVDLAPLPSRKHVYQILYPDPAMGYLITNMYESWVERTLSNHCPHSLGIRYFLDIGTYIHTNISRVIVVVEEELGALSINIPIIPDYLWWLDPTLSHEESIPMYALLIAIGNSRLPGGSKSKPKERLLTEALYVGTQCKGKLLHEWIAAIRGGPIPPGYGSRGGLLAPTARDNSWCVSGISNFWGEKLYREWVTIMDTIYEWT